MNDCVFCKIIRKEIPAHIVHENGKSLAFLDIKPVNPGHVLVIPKEHYPDFASTPDDLLADIAVVAKKMAVAVQTATGSPAFNIGVNNGRAAGQLVDHMHLHVMPRHDGDGHELWHGKAYEEGEAAALAEKIKMALQ